MDRGEVNEVLEACGFVRVAVDHWQCDVFEVVLIGDGRFWIIEEDQVTYRDLPFTDVVRWTEGERTF